MAQQLIDILGISQTQAESLLSMTGNSVNQAMDLYLKTQSPSPVRPLQSSTAAAASEAVQPPVLEQQPQEQPQPEDAPRPPALQIKEGGKTIRVRVMGPAGQHDVTVDDHTPLGMFRADLAEKTGIAPHKQQILGGFPPAPLPADDITKTLKELGVKSGDRLTVEDAKPKEMVQGHTKGRYVPPSDKRGSFTKREMPADNSCLFHAIDYVLNNKASGNAQQLRGQIAEIVTSNPEKYTTDFLGQPNAFYAQWIQQKDTWGGAIELSIMSFLHQIEICALDIQTKKIYRYGEDEGHTSRCFLLYSGRHYDAMALAPYGGATGQDQVLFSTTDDIVFKKARDFVDSEHANAVANPK